MEQAEQVDSRRAIEELKELGDLTGGPEGARRVAWTDEWARAWSWLREKLDEIDCEVETDEAGNLWATVPGDFEDAVVLGGHIDSVPNGGWLDGALNTVAALEVLRTLAPQKRPVAISIHPDAEKRSSRKLSVGCLHPLVLLSKPYAADTIPWVEPARVEHACLYPPFPSEAYGGQSNAPIADAIQSCK